MTTLEKARYITDKYNGLGMSVQVFAGFCGFHYSYLSHYINGTKSGSKELEASIEKAIAELKEKWAAL